MLDSHTALCSQRFHSAFSLGSPDFALRKSHCLPPFSLSPRAERRHKSLCTRAERRHNSLSPRAERRHNSHCSRAERNFLSLCERVGMVCYVGLVCGTFLQGGWQLGRWGRCKLHPSPQVVRNVSTGLENLSRAEVGETHSLDITWYHMIPHDTADITWYWISHDITWYHMISHDTDRYINDIMK